ncbi:MAG: hypothetical protein PVJ27_02885 [Candidatus Brocadiaceae bacterium]|jgi:hypothetical protein
MTPGKVLLMMVLSAAFALAVVWQSAAMREAGYRLQDLRSQIVEQRARRAVYLTHLSRLKSPRRIVALLDWLGLDLQEPSAGSAHLGPIALDETDAVDTGGAITVAELPRTVPSE